MRALGLAAILVAGAARVTAADPATTPEPIQLRYSAPPGCPDEAAFFAGVTTRANAVCVASAERTFDVRIVIEEPALVRGTLVVTAADDVTTRQVTGVTCAETAGAVALVAALAIEERAPGLSPVDRVDVPPRWRFGAGGGIAAIGRITPVTLLGVPVFATANRDRTGLRLRLGVVRTLRGDVTMRAGTTDFRWTVVRAEACPYVFVHGMLKVAPCVGLEAGVIDARGTLVDMPATDQRPWVAPDATLRLGVRRGRFALEVEGTLSMPVVRDRFYLAPSTTIYEVPAVTTIVGTNLTIDIL